MEWTFEVDLERPGMLSWEEEYGVPWEGKKTAAELLAVALDFFLVSSYTYNQAGRSHIGWLVSNMYVD